MVYVRLQSSCVCVCVGLHLVQSAEYVFFNVPATKEGRFILLTISTTTILLLSICDASWKFNKLRCHKARWLRPCNRFFLKPTAFFLIHSKIKYFHFLHRKHNILHWVCFFFEWCKYTFVHFYSSQWIFVRAELSCTAHTWYKPWESASLFSDWHASQEFECMALRSKMRWKMVGGSYLLNCLKGHWRLQMFTGRNKDKFNCISESTTMLQRNCWFKSKVELTLWIGKVVCN